MAASSYLGIDLGTTSSVAVVTDVRRERGGFFASFVPALRTMRRRVLEVRAAEEGARS